MSEIKRFEPRGMCWWLGYCNWWNPPLDIICKGEDNYGNKNDFCIKCWEFKGFKIGCPHRYHEMHDSKWIAECELMRKSCNIENCPKEYLEDTTVLNVGNLKNKWSE